MFDMDEIETASIQVPTDTASSGKQKLPLVNDLACQLKKKMLEHGGYEAIWRKLDARLKDEDEKTIDGPKTSKTRKIKHGAFISACKRLGSKVDSDSSEKMTFGIRGNPLLLMNVFDILKINSYRDLETYSYKKNSIEDEIANMGLNIEDMNRKLDALSDKIEGTPKKSIRTIKLTADFEEMLKRLYSILTENKDPLLNDFFYLLSKEVDTLSNIEQTTTNLKNYKNIYKEKKLFFEKKAHMNFILTMQHLFEGEKKRILFLILLLEDYKEYIIHNNVLGGYVRRINLLEIQSAFFSNLNECRLSPLYLTHLLLQMAKLFMRGKINVSIGLSEDASEYLSSINIKEQNDKYIFGIITRINNKIKILLNIFVENNVKNVSEEKYLEYVDIAKEIVALFYGIFVTSKINLANDDLTRNAKTIADLIKIMKSHISGVYLISVDDIRQLEKLENKISDIANATARDINA